MSDVMTHWQTFSYDGIQLLTTEYYYPDHDLFSLEAFACKDGIELQE
jgi:hypothetical protein